MITLFRHAGGGLFHALAELGAARMSPPRDPLAAAHRLAGALGAVARAHALVTTVHGAVYRSPALIVSNHVSYLDPIAILPVCPAVPLAKSDVGRWPVVGPLANALGVELVRRDSVTSRARTLRRIHDLLAAGTPVLNFPEGTTTHGDRIAPFWRGGFGIAQRLGVPVVPVAIRYADPSLAWCDGATFVPHYLATASKPSIAVALAFGAPMWPRTGEPPEVMAERARHVIHQLLVEELHAGIRVDLSPPRSNPVLPARRDDRARERGRRRAGRAA